MNDNNQRPTDNLLDDPRLTAFALGELVGEEQAELAQLVQQSADAQAAVREIRSVSETLRETRQQEVALQQSAAADAALADRVKEQLAASRKTPIGAEAALETPQFNRSAWASLAALLVVAITFGLWAAPRYFDDPDVVQVHDQPDLTALAAELRQKNEEYRLGKISLKMLEEELAMERAAKRGQLAQLQSERDRLEAEVAEDQKKLLELVTALDGRINLGKQDDGWTSYPPLAQDQGLRAAVAESREALGLLSTDATGTEFFSRTQNAESTVDHFVRGQLAESPEDGELYIDGYVDGLGVLLPEGTVIEQGLSKGTELAPLPFFSGVNEDGAVVGLIDQSESMSLNGQTDADGEDWLQLTLRRQKYASGDLSDGVPAGGSVTFGDEHSALITESVDLEVWRDAGGSGEIAEFETNLSLELGITEDATGGVVGGLGGGGTSGGGDSGTPSGTALAGRRGEDGGITGGDGETSPTSEVESRRLAGTSVAGRRITEGETTEPAEGESSDRMRGDYQRVMELADQRLRQFVDAINGVEKSAVPFPEEPALVYPSESQQANEDTSGDGTLSEGQGSNDEIDESRVAQTAAGRVDPSGAQQRNAPGGNSSEQGEGSSDDANLLDKFVASGDLVDATDEELRASVSATDIDALTTRFETLHESIEQLGSMSAELGNANGENAADERVARHVETLRSLREQLLEAHQLVDAKFEDTIRLTDRNPGAEGQLRILQQRQAQLVEDLAKAERILNANGVSVNGSDGPMPPVEGEVVAVNNERQLAEISLGSDDGLRKGRSLEIYRGSVHVGQAEVLDVRADRAVVKLDRKRAGGIPRVGDRIESRPATDESVAQAPTTVPKTIQPPKLTPEQQQRRRRALDALLALNRQSTERFSKDAARLQQYEMAFRMQSAPSDLAERARLEKRQQAIDEMKSLNEAAQQTVNQRFEAEREILGVQWKDATGSGDELNTLKGKRNELVTKLAAISGKMTEQSRELARLDKETATARKEKLRDRQARTWRRSSRQPNTSRLMIGDKEDLPLQGMQANVQVDGFRARVLLDLYFYNEHAKQLEGNFQLRLPNEASLYYFAFGETHYGLENQTRPAARQAFFSVPAERRLGTTPAEILFARSEGWRQPKEARMVQKEKAAFAYRQTVRRRVDPALVEWAGASVFAARVYPLMPQKLHRIVIGYDVNLEQIDGDLEYRLVLPSWVPEAKVDINVSALPGVTAVVTPEARPFTSAGRAYYHFDHPESREFVVRLEQPGSVLLHGAEPEAGEFFATRITPDLPAGAMTSGSPEAVFLVDTSLSANPDKFNVWLDVMRANLDANRETTKRFAVQFFNIERHWWQPRFVDNTPENVAALIDYCHTLSLEGATDLAAALAEAAAPAFEANGQKSDDLFLKSEQRDFFLLSDGAITWGERNGDMIVRQFAARGPVFAYRTGLAGTDVRALAHVTRETGGAVFAVTSEDQIDKAAVAHRQRPWQLDEVTLDGSDELLIAGRPRHLFPGQSLSLVGRGTVRENAQVVVKVSRGGESRTLQIPFARLIESDLAPRQYGEVAVAGLEQLGNSREDVATAYARHFRIAGRTCSLLMLESEADYARFKIAPEDDAFVVKSTGAGRVIEQTRSERAEQLADPKARLIGWLNRLEKMDGFKFKISPALRIAVDTLPTEAFDVKLPSLSASSHNWEGIDEALREKLSTRDFGYTEIMQEAQRRRAEFGAVDALRAASSLVEERPGDLVLMRDIGFSAMDWGLPEQAYYLLQRVAEARPFEPQTYLAIAESLAASGHDDLAMIYYEVAVGGKWDTRFQEVNRIAKTQYLHFLRTATGDKAAMHARDFATARRDQIAKQVNIKEADLLVVMMWNTDGTDVDLHIYEPGGEVCNYQHRMTKSGGSLTRDVTQGYGPEMYVLRNAPQGVYNIRAKYYSSDTNRMSARSRVFTTIYENWGRADERMLRQTVTLEEGKQMHDVAQVKRNAPEKK